MGHLTYDEAKALLEATTEALVIARTKLASIAEAAHLPFEHTGHDDDPEPDCAACWAAFILAILGGES